MNKSLKAKNLPLFSIIDLDQLLSLIHISALPDGANGQLQRLSAAVEPQGQKAVVSGYRA